MRLLLLLAFVLPAAPAQAQELGRLFFTPEQRGALEARSKERVPNKPASAAVVSPSRPREASGPGWAVASRWVLGR